MKKFIFIYHGHDATSPATVQAWQDWFDRRAHYFVDIGSSFGHCRIVAGQNNRVITVFQPSQWLLVPTIFRVILRGT